MEKTRKRGERLAHERRVKRKYLPVAKRFAGKLNSWVNTWGTAPNGVWSPLVQPDGRKRREEFIARTVRSLAHHHKCPCGMCKRERYDRTTSRRELTSELATWE